MNARNPASRARFLKVYCLFDVGMNKQRQQFQAIHLKELVHNSQETAPQTFHETQSNRSGMHMQQ
jgi:hypothetical protein